MKTLVFRGLMAALFVLVGSCGGGSSSDEEQIHLGQPGVTAQGLTTGTSVTVTLAPGSSTLTLDPSGTTDQFNTRVASGTDHKVSVQSVSGTTCVFSGSSATSSSDDPNTVHTLYCGTAIPSTGGGTTGGSSGGSTGGSGDLQLSLTLTDSIGQTLGTTSNPVTTNTPGIASATLTQGGSALPSEVITFQTTIGTLDPSSGTALTDGSGAAQIDVLAGSTGGAGTLTASATIDGEQVLTQYNFQVSTTSSGGGTTPTVTLAMGTGTGASFQDSVLNASSTATGVGSTVNISATIVDTSNSNAAWSGITDVTFSSTCVSQGVATIDSPVTAVSGTASATYTPQTGCTNDTIVASASANGQQLSASSPAISVTQSPPNSITFLEANPSVIGLQGSGQAGTPETSNLVFQVNDENGNPVGSGVDVDFDVVAGAGGFAITSGTSSSTNNQGQVSVTVESGTVPTVGTVRATVVGTTVEGTGSVSIQTGIASQERFSIAVDTVNPAAGDELGVTVNVQARAADRFGNWVPDGTQINFTSELGDINASCETSNGGCAVTWTSQGAQSSFYDSARAARPCFSGTNVNRDRQGLLNTVGCGQNDRFGRSTITAWTVGEEAFQDANGNNLFDDTEGWLAMPEAFRDNNEIALRTDTNGLFDEFMDFNENGSYDGPGSTFRGLGCTSAALAAGHCSQLANVRDSALIVLASDAAQVRLYASGTDLSNTDWQDPAGGTPTQWGSATLTGVDTTSVDATKYSLASDGQTYAVTGTTATITAVVSDVNGNAPAIGTVITANPGDMEMNGPDSCEVRNRSEPKVCTFSFIYQGTDTGTLKSIVITAESQGEPYSRAVGVTIP